MFDITLTFDNGPEKEVTPGVLDALKERDIACTFFFIGEKVRENRDIVARAHAEGHWIANHTWSHSIPLGDRPANGDAIEEVERAQNEIAEFAHEAKFFRPFANGQVGPKLLNREVAEYLCAEEFTCALWTVLGEEWLAPDGWVEPVIAKCKKKPWSLLVIHDLPTGAMKHLPRFLDTALEQGARFRQDFPPDGILIDRGKIVQPLDRYVSGGWDDREFLNQ